MIKTSIENLRVQMININILRPFVLKIIQLAFNAGTLTIILVNKKEKFFFKKKEKEEKKS